MTIDLIAKLGAMISSKGVNILAPARITFPAECGIQQKCFASRISNFAFLKGAVYFTAGISWEVYKKINKRILVHANQLV